MESTAPVSTESFSGSSLVCYNPSSDAQQAIEQPPQNSCTTSFDAADDASFIELDPNLPASRRFYRVAKDFSFDFRAHESPEIDADELITDDILPLPLPTAADQSFKTEKTMGNYNYNYKDEAEDANSSNRVACASLRRCKTVTKRIFHKYLEFIAPLWEKLRRRRRFVSTSRVTSMSTQLDQCLTPANSSPKANSAASAATKYEHFISDSECSISEAVLHCKRTNGMQCQLP